MTGAQQIRVLIVDDSEILRWGVRHYLSRYEDLVCVGEAASGLEAIDLCARLQPDVVLMDVIMPGLDGNEAARRVLEAWPQIKVIMLTSFSDEASIIQTLQAGAAGYLLKNTPADALAGAIRSAHLGRVTLAREATDTLVRHTHPRPTPRDYKLTERETEVLGLLALGLSNAQIAERLYVSIATAKFHVRGILGKLNVSSRTEAASFALQNDLVPH
jgi:NarL family two-component system response regulator LiaR